jgi:uncharacterized OsmC-like protein
MEGAMVEMSGTYEGDLRCRARHGPSGGEIVTDAPADNEGLGRAFSPTDLVGAALGTCVLTILGIAARKRGVSLSGARFTVTKEMAADPPRRIARLACGFILPAALPDHERKLLERAARTCPVTETLRGRVEMEFVFRYE